MPDKKQQYHLQPPFGLMNDPNGLCWFEGRYNVFFQWNPLAKDHSHKEWGWFSSPDLLRWDFCGSAMAPSEPYDQSGTHSGSAIVVDGQLRLYYTGSDKSSGRRRSSQCLAVLGNDGSFHKRGVVVSTPPGFTEHFRDPSVTRMADGTYRMLLGAQREDGLGAVAMCESADALRWEYGGILAATDDHEMVECPDLVVSDGQAMLLYGLQRRDNARDAVLSAFSYCMPMDPAGRGPYTLASAHLVDEGFDFYAPQTLAAPDGRQLLLAWMSRMEDEAESAFFQGEPYMHCLTMPREAGVEDGRLWQRPARELYGMLGGEIPLERGKGDLAAGIPGRAFHLDIAWDGPADGFSLAYEGCRVRQENGRLVLTRRRWTDGVEEVRSVRTEPRRMEIWADTSSLELFIDHGQHVMSARFMPMGNTPVLRISQHRCARASLRAVCPPG